MKTPLVSVIVPAFNEEDNIGRLVKSVKNQSYRNVEMIVVDDGSTDKTVEVAKSAGAHVYKRKHAERSIQRNFGVEKSKGKYLLIVDADMELSRDVVRDCLSMMKRKKYGALVVPERTVGKGFVPRIRRFEREMYMGEMIYEVARFFERSIFFEFGGYDPKLTGPEDYDLPYRISKKYKIGRGKEYILHHEAGRGILNLMKKKYKYAKGGFYYARKHPELVSRQGTIFFRPVYLKHWKKFLRNPLLGAAFIFIRILETVAAVSGFISAVGIVEFVRVFWRMFKK